MNSGHPNEPRDPRWDEGDPLWRLLGEAPRSEVPAWFTAQTLARCRREMHDARGIPALKAQLRQIWRWALAGGVAVSMAMAMMTPHVRPDAQPDERSVQEAFAVVASLDSSDSDSSTPSWQDSSSL